MFKLNGSSAWHILPSTLMMFSCNSGFKDKILLFDATVWVVLSEQYSSRKESTCATLQMVLMASSKSFRNKYEKSVVMFMQRFCIYQIYFKLYYPCYMPHQFIPRRIIVPTNTLFDWLIVTLTCATFQFNVKLSICLLRAGDSIWPLFLI